MYMHNDIAIDPIDEKVQLLHDFCILTDESVEDEATIRNILATCKTELQMEHKLHNVLRGNETLKDLIQREELKCTK